MLYPEEKIREIAEGYYKRGDFFCSEAVLRTFLDVFETGFDNSVLALSGGFPGGMGGAGCSCGAVIGGIMVLGMFFGRSVAKDPDVFRCMELSKELHDAFRTKHKAVCCRILNRNVKDGSPEQRAACALRAGDAAVMTLQILERELIKRGWESKIRCKLS